MKMKKLLTVLICMGLLLFAVSCSNTKEENPKEKEIVLADNSTYQGAVNNYYRAYERCDARYQMSTLAPQYVDYVMANFGYATEEEMTDALQVMIEESCASYSATFGEGYMLLESITEATDLTAEEVETLKTEMQTGYGREFPIQEAKELNVNIVVSVAGGDDSTSQAAAQSDSVMTVAKIDDCWYILK